MATVPAAELGILVGDYNLFTISNSQKFIKVKDKVIHPDYNVPSPLNNDIGNFSNIIICQVYLVFLIPDEIFTLKNPVLHFRKSPFHFIPVM